MSVSTFVNAAARRFEFQAGELAFDLVDPGRIGGPENAHGTAGAGPASGVRPAPCACCGCRGAAPPAEGLTHRIAGSHRTAATYNLRVPFFCAKLNLRIPRPERAVLVPPPPLPQPLRMALYRLDAEVPNFDQEAVLAASQPALRSCRWKMSPGAAGERSTWQRCEIRAGPDGSRRRRKRSASGAVAEGRPVRACGRSWAADCRRPAGLKTALRRSRCCPSPTVQVGRSACATGSRETARSGRRC